MVYNAMDRITDRAVISSDHASNTFAITGEEHQRAVACSQIVDRQKRKAVCFVIDVYRLQNDHTPSVQ